MGKAALRQDGRVPADQEILISVDIEASGPTPSTGSLIAIGACLVNDPATAIYLELRPLPGLPWSERAERVHLLPRAKLVREGLAPSVAMAQFGDWVAEASAGYRAVFVGWNAGYDWMFTADYFERFLGRNPFGIAPLDIKAYLMGRDRLSRWADTRRSVVAERYGEVEPLTHNALDDARQQAAFIRRLLQQDDQPA